MNIHGNYAAAGYARVERLLSDEVANALVNRFWSDVMNEAAPVSFGKHGALTSLATEVYGPDYPPLTTFLWAMTPVMEMIADRDLLPSYCFFRIYRRGDRLKVHADRPACEHSLSLTLHYSDGEIWPFEIGSIEAAGLPTYVSDFGDEPYSSVLMKPGDAVIYRGPRRRHARMTANPNAWSAHLFLHWVERTGEHRDFAFEESPPVKSASNSS